jgi:ketosteroid isomerase-like protein
MSGVLAGCAAASPDAKCPEASTTVVPLAPPHVATEAEMNAEHERLVNAYRTNDIATLERHLAPDHVHNNVFGMRQDKQTLLNDMRNGTLVFKSYDLGDSQWIISPDVAIVTGTLHAEATRAGKPVPATDFRYARIFVKRDGAWLEWLFQNTMIMTPPKE